MKSQVTTKGGDSGETSALSGERLSKGHVIMDCVGALDELRAQTALARQVVLHTSARDAEAVAEFLRWLTHIYFLLGTALSDPRGLRPEYRRVDLGLGHLRRLEREQERFEAATPLPPSFIAAASNLAAAQVDVACGVARRLERETARLKQTVPEFAAEHIFAFENRLSDCLFMLARYLESGQHLTVDYALCAEDATDLEKGP